MSDYIICRACGEGYDTKNSHDCPGTDADRLDDIESRLRTLEEAKRDEAKDICTDFGQVSDGDVERCLRTQLDAMAASRLTDAREALIDSRLEVAALKAQLKAVIADIAAELMKYERDAFAGLLIGQIRQGIEKKWVKP